MLLRQKEIKNGNVIGWFEGRMEFGVDALGNRSILANPRSSQMKSRLNRVIKEGFWMYDANGKRRTFKRVYFYYNGWPFHI